jgi:predicted ABC-type sugar transport system permease subunit
MMLNRTRFGRNAYGIGSSPEVAACLSGISLRANLYFAYGISGLIAGCRPDGAGSHGRADVTAALTSYIQSQYR